jgi:hypothetical protein
MIQPAAVPAQRPELTRDEKVENLLINFSMLIIGMFEGALTAMAEGLTDALTKTAESITEALDSKGDSSSSKTPASPDPESEVHAKVKEVFSRLRREVTEGFSNKDRSFTKFIQDPAFDTGVRIVESHRFKLPRLTEHLTDSDLAGYMTLIQEGNGEVAKMMQELEEWQRTTPRFRG